MERTLILVKPDAMQRGLAGTIITRLEQRGLKLAAMKLLQMDRALAERHYAVHIGKPFFESLVSYITSSPIIAMVVEGNRAVEIARQTMGTTDPANAQTGSIRGDFGMDIGRNLVHGSDSIENAAKEIDLFFTPEEIITYNRDIDGWITES